MDPSKLIIFYDIASGPPVTTFAPNPWKTRYALNFKGVHYQTAWVELPDVKATRQRLNAAPNRVLPDGSDFYTLPIIQDRSRNDKVVGDSFDIAVYLDEIYSGPRLFPASSLGLYRALNAQVDAIFTDRVALFLHGMPLNPETADRTKREFEKRGLGLLTWEQMGVKDGARIEMFANLRSALEALVTPYTICKGPYLDGETCSYADIIVGAWLQFVKATVTNTEWIDICSWHDGIWGRLFSALEKYATIV